VRAALAVAFVLFATHVAVAQERPRTPGIELRLDGIFPRGAVTTHGGLGLARVLTRNVGAQLVVAGGITKREDADDPRASARADLLARFAPPPSRPGAWSAYASAGVSALFERETSGRAVLVLLVGARGRRAFVDAGVGGGVRVGGGVVF
jgi:hypothetical protein